MIALVCWPKHMIFVAETHLGGGVMSAFVFLSTAISWVLTSTYDGSTALRKYMYKAHEDSDYTAMNAVVHWHLGAKTRAHPGGKVVSTVIIFVFLMAAIARSTQTTWSPCDVH